jgi:hypothetical protein
MLRLAALILAGMTFLAVPARAAEPPVDPLTFERIILVNLETQTATYYKGGDKVLTTPISSGREEKPTPTGMFTITDKHAKWTSTIYNVPMPNFLRLNEGSVGMHAGFLPGFPASSGCIRMPETAAQQLFDEVPVGTKVCIYGQAPSLASIQEKWKGRSLAKSHAYAKKGNGAKTGQGWEPPFPVIYTSWIRPKSETTSKSGN